MRARELFTEIMLIQHRHHRHGSLGDVTRSRDRGNVIQNEEREKGENMDSREREREKEGKREREEENVGKRKR